jgi:hypothetical protein
VCPAVSAQYLTRTINHPWRIYSNSGDNLANGPRTFLGYHVRKGLGISAFIIGAQMGVRMLEKSSYPLRPSTAVGILGLALSACSPNMSSDGQSAKVQGIAITASAPTKAEATAAQWQSVVNGVFDKVNARKIHDKKKPEYVLDEGTIDENGVTEFFGCFDKSPPQCEVWASGKRDGFRKVHFFSDPLWDWDESGYKYAKGIGKPSVRGYISLSDCRRPKIVLEPKFRGSGWIFLEQFSLMLDGTIVLERKFDIGEVDRENDHNSVTESAHINLDEQEMQRIRNVNSSKQVLIRLTGKKAYVGLDSDATKTFVQGMSKLLRLYDALDLAIVKVGPVKDAACPA